MMEVLTVSIQVYLNVLNRVRNNSEFGQIYKKDGNLYVSIPPEVGKLKATKYAIKLLKGVLNNYGYSYPYAVDFYICQSPILNNYSLFLYNISFSDSILECDNINILMAHSSNEFFIRLGNTYSIRGNNNYGDFIVDGFTRGMSGYI